MVGSDPVMPLSPLCGGELGSAGGRLVPGGKVGRPTEGAVVGSEPVMPLSPLCGGELEITGGRLVTGGVLGDTLLPLAAGFALGKYEG